MLVSSVPLSETHMQPACRAGDERVELARDPQAGQRGVGDQARHSRVKSSTTARMRKRRPSVKASRQKSRRPALVRPLRQRHRRPRAQRPLASAAPAHLKPLLAIEPPQLLVVHGDALARRAGHAGADSRSAGAPPPARAAGPAPPHRPAGCCGSAPSCGPLRAHDTPAARSPRTSPRR